MGDCQGSTIGVQDKLPFGLEKFMDGVVPRTRRHLWRNETTSKNTMDGLSRLYLHDCTFRHERGSLNRHAYIYTLKEKDIENYKDLILKVQEISVC